MKKPIQTRPSAAARHRLYRSQKATAGQESRHPFERVHVNAEDKLKIEIASRRRESNAEFAVRYRDAGRERFVSIGAGKMISADAGRREAHDS